jgi:hypothetical protein
VGNRSRQPEANRASPQYDSEINRPKKLPGRRKYEGKRLDVSCGVCLARSSRVPAINDRVEQLLPLFILAAGSFSNMFTTYSHAVLGCSRQRA